jgi:hypothetical protein
MWVLRLALVAFLGVLGVWLFDFNDMVSVLRAYDFPLLSESSVPGVRSVAYRLTPQQLETEARDRNRARMDVPRLSWDTMNFRPAPSQAIIFRSADDPMAEWRRNRQAVAGLRLQESECRYWRDQRGQVDPDTIAEQLTRNHCYPE